MGVAAATACGGGKRWGAGIAVSELDHGGGRPADGALCGDAFLAGVAAVGLLGGPRRSPEVDHFCSNTVDHIEYTRCHVARRRESQFIIRAPGAGGGAFIRAARPRATSPKLDANAAPSGPAWWSTFRD